MPYAAVGLFPPIALFERRLCHHIPYDPMVFVYPAGNCITAGRRSPIDLQVRYNPEKLTESALVLMLFLMELVIATYVYYQRPKEYCPGETLLGVALHIL